MDKIIPYKELKQYNGKDGRPVYVSYKGVVYDVTNSDLWKTGRHQNKHDAGDNHTGIFSQAPHGEEVFQKFPVVGKLG